MEVSSIASNGFKVKKSQSPTVLISVLFTFLPSSFHSHSFAPVSYLFTSDASVSFFKRSFLMANFKLRKEGNWVAFLLQNDMRYYDIVHSCIRFHVARVARWSVAAFAFQFCVF